MRRWTSRSCPSKLCSSLDSCTILAITAGPNLKRLRTGVFAQLANVIRAGTRSPTLISMNSGLLPMKHAPVSDGCGIRRAQGSGDQHRQENQKTNPAAQAWIAFHILTASQGNDARGLDSVAPPRRISRDADQRRLRV